LLYWMVVLAPGLDRNLVFRRIGDRLRSSAFWSDRRFPRPGDGLRADCHRGHDVGGLAGTSQGRRIARRRELQHLGGGVGLSVLGHGTSGPAGWQPVPRRRLDGERIAWREAPSRPEVR